MTGIVASAVKKINWSRRRFHRIVREMRSHRFPESNRFPIQFLLLCWGIVPTCASLLRERLLGRRNRSGSRRARLMSWMIRHRLPPAVFLAAACIAAGVVLFFTFYTKGVEVLFDGNAIAAVTSESAAKKAQLDLERLTAKTLGKPYSIEAGTIQYTQKWMMRKDLDDAETYQEKLSQELGMVRQAYCLYIDGVRVGAAPYRGALEELLEQLQKAVTDENTISCTFAEEVEICQEYVPAEEIMNLGYLAELLYSTKTEEVTYEVKKGDTWSQIAENNGLTSKELQALNPGYNINSLNIGEVLTISASVPYLTMTVVQQQRYLDDVAYEIQYTDTADMYQGDYEITSPGAYGKADVVADVTYVNGEETERTVLSSVLLQNPVTEQRLQGTTPRPTWYPTGTFRWPCSGRITSTFGGRKSPGGIGSTNHKGIDIAVRYGTAVCAADGGTVSYAGWMSGYGYLVEIDHGNGYVTRYGHNSKILVSKGKHVYKGQQIAKAGSTGNSTGVHCHFEIRYNGTPKNPLNYL